MTTILNQHIDGEEKVISYANCRLSKYKKIYGISDKEGLGMIFSIKHWSMVVHASRYPSRPPIWHVCPMSLMFVKKKTAFSEWKILRW